MMLTDRRAILRFPGLSALLRPECIQTLRLADWRDMDEPFLGPLRIVVFDLDGTLIDSLPDIAHAVNEVRRAHAASPTPLEQIRAAIGDGARVLAGRVFGDLREVGEEAILGEFLAEYERCSVENLEPWRTGSQELLDLLTGHGLELAILSNKPLALTERILENTEARSQFVLVRGPENSPAAKPDPLALLDIIASRGFAPTEACFVGDSIVDFATGRAAGVFTIGVRGGYRADGEPGPDVWCDDPAAVFDCLRVSSIRTAEAE